MHCSASQYGVWECISARRSTPYNLKSRDWLTLVDLPSLPRGPTAPPPAYPSTIIQPRSLSSDTIIIINSIQWHHHEIITTFLVHPASLLNYLTGRIRYCMYYLPPSSICFRFDCYILYCTPYRTSHNLHSSPQAIVKSRHE